MKYIRIKNNGVIAPEALYLLGASTKREDTTKIGQFGSGNKFALAYFLRNGYEVKVYAGTNEIPVTTVEKEFRGKQFNVICVDGKETSLTTDTGKDWELWQAIREVYCNALDEGNCSLDFVQNLEPVEDQTHFYIENKQQTIEFVANFDNYFATNKKVLFECEHGRILEKTGDTANVYRKGIKCYVTNLKSMFDYDFNEVDIDENRLVKYNWTIGEKIWKLLYACDNEEVIKQALHNCTNESFIEGDISDWSTISASSISLKFKEVLKSINIAPFGFAGLLKEDEKHNHVIVPTKVYKSVRGLIEDENVGKSFKVNKSGGVFREVEPNAEQYETIKNAMAFFAMCDYAITYPIKVAIFDAKNVMGCAYDETIFISDNALIKGTNEVINTIIEEQIHLARGVKDETRAMQTALIDELINYMKKVNEITV